MGFVSETLSGVEGIQWFYIVGLMIFLGLFAGIVIHTLRLPKKKLLQYKSSIFDREELTGK